MVLLHSAFFQLFNYSNFVFLLFLLFFFWQCEYDGCHLSFKKNSQLTRHICVHTNEYRFKYVNLKMDEQRYGI